MDFPMISISFATFLEYDDSILLPLVILILFLIVFVSYALWTHIRLRRKVGKVEEALKRLEKKDPIWRKEQLETFVEFFMKELLKAWSGKDREKLKGLISTDLYPTRERILDKMDEVGQFNVVDVLKVHEILLVDIKDFTNDEFDRFTARIRYDAVNFTKNYRDKWEEPKWGEDVDSNPDKESKEYIEFWTFVRRGETWKLHRLEKEWKEGDYASSDPVLEDEKYEDIPTGSRG
jgi:hypothetical protein